MESPVLRYLPGIMLLLSAAIAQARQDAANQQAVTDSVISHVFQPAKVAATDARINGLKTPPGFTITKFAEGLGKPRMIAIHQDGTVYVTNRDEGTLTMLKDTDRDGKADSRKVVARKPQLHGIAISGGKMFLVTVNEVYTALINNDGSLDNLQLIIGDLPDGGQHGNRTIETGPDGMLYLSVGSTCNACDETNKENATLLQIDPENFSRQIFAKGLRNTIGFEWHPETGELFGFDHGIDHLGDNDQQEELNHLQKGKDYGWPFIYDKGVFNKADKPKNMTHEEYARLTTDPVLLYTAHAAPLDFIFYKGKQFPADFTGDAFATMHGSWNRKPPSGYKVVRIRFENGQPVNAEDFITGFLSPDQQTQFGRVCGLAIDPEGSLLVSDDSNGIIYRVSYNSKN